MDYAGRPIQRQKDFFGVDLPEAHRGFGHEGPVASWVTKELNALTGGDERRSGYVDISPAGLDHVFEYFTGGVGKVIRKGLNLPFKLDGEEIYNPRTWPIVDRFIEGKNKYWLNQRYYEILEGVKAAAAQEKLLEDSESPSADARLEKLERDYGPELELRKSFERQQRKLGDIYKERAEVEKSTTLSAEQRAEQKQAIEDELRAMQLDLVKEYTTLVKQHTGKQLGTSPSAKPASADNSNGFEEYSLPR
jgi:hypothetical protein